MVFYARKNNVEVYNEGSKLILAKTKKSDKRVLKDILKLLMYAISKLDSPHVVRAIMSTSSIAQYEQESDSKNRYIALINCRLESCALQHIVEYDSYYHKDTGNVQGTRHLVI